MILINLLRGLNERLTNLYVKVSEKLDKTTGRLAAKKIYCNLKVIEQLTYQKARIEEQNKVLTSIIQESEGIIQEGE